MRDEVAADIQLISLPFFLSLYRIEANCFSLILFGELFFMVTIGRIVAN